MTRPRPLLRTLASLECSLVARWTDREPIRTLGRFAAAVLRGAVVLVTGPAAHAQCTGNLLSNASFESHTGGTNSTGDPIPSVWVLESGEDGATTAFSPPDGSARRRTRTARIRVP